MTPPPPYRPQPRPGGAAMGPGADANGPNLVHEAQAWFARIPAVTRYLFSAVVLTTVSMKAGMLSPYALMLNPLKPYQLWRLFTNMLVLNGRGFELMMNLYFLYTYSSRLETGEFHGKRAEYVWFLVVVTLVADVFGLALGIPVLGQALMASIIYLWSQRNRASIVSFYFGIQFPAMYLPLAVIFFEFMTSDGSMPIPFIAGLVAGHAYWYSEEMYPRTHAGRKLLPMPQWL